MGQWGAGIMQGDTPMDIEYDFEKCFPQGHVKPDEAVEFIKRMNDEPIGGAVVGYLIIQRGGPFSDELRQMVISSIELDRSEIEVVGWKDPEERHKALDEFKAIVEAYPDAGAKVELPEQMGLLDTIATSLGQG
jgi:hypothetical protein